MRGVLVVRELAVLVEEEGGVVYLLWDRHYLVEVAFEVLESRFVELIVSILDSGCEEGSYREETLVISLRSWSRFRVCISTWSLSSTSCSFSAFLMLFSLIIFSLIDPVSLLNDLLSIFLKSLQIPLNLTVHNGKFFSQVAYYHPLTS